MSEPAPAPAFGQIAWIDLTSPNAEGVRVFYEHVAGWSAAPVSRGDHNDYCMVPAGACHALGENADLDESVRRCAERGGKVRVPERRFAGMGRYTVIEDPAGAVAALFQPE